MIYQILFLAIAGFIFCLLVFAKQILLWYSAKSTGLSVSLMKIIGLKFSRVSSIDVMRGLILSKKAELNLNFNQLHKAAKAGANIQNIVLGMVASDQAGKPLNLIKAIELDRQDINILQYVKSGGES